MCGRYTLSTVDGPDIAQRFGLLDPPEEATLGRCNVCPTETVAAVLEPGPKLELEWLMASGPAGQREAGPGDFAVSGVPITAEELEQRYARYVLGRLGGKRTEAAKALGLSYPTFLKRLGE